MDNVEKAGSALINLLAASLSFSQNGQTQPSSFSNAISKLVELVKSGDIVRPDSLNAVLKDFVDALEVADEIVPANIKPFVLAIENLLSPQLKPAEVQSGLSGPK